MSLHFPFRAAACALPVLLAACGPVDVEGDWDGTWRVPLTGVSGGLSMSLTQDGDALSGSFDLDGTLCVGSGSVDGTLDRRSFDVVLRNGVGGEVTLDGTVGAADDRISGDFHVTGGACQAADGTFEVRRE
jgi:hypothetical protein